MPVPDDGLIPGQTGRLTVDCKITLTLSQNGSDLALVMRHQAKRHYPVGSERKAQVLRRSAGDWTELQLSFTTANTNISS
jgi:hypothetical protein